MRGCGATYEYYCEDHGRGSLYYDDEDTIRMYDSFHATGKMVKARCGGTNAWGEIGYCEKCEALLRGEGIKELKRIKHPVRYFYDAGSYTLIVKLPKGIDHSTAWHILSARYNRSCHCEHDCCGCVCGGVHEVIKMRRREWAVKTSYGYNC